MLSEAQILEWSRGYIGAYEAPDQTLGKNDLSPYVLGLMSGSDLDPEDVWQIILKVLSQSPSDKVIEVLAAGPLEDLINDYGARFIDRIENEARRNPAFRHLLGGVWESSAPDVWSRVEKARAGTRW